MKGTINILKNKLKQYYNWDFVTHDPIQIPHRFTKKQDIEISSFFATLFALGKRKIIISKTTELICKMDNSPYDFIKNYKQSDLKNFESFVHRFFKYEDLVFLFQFLQTHYSKHQSMESAFTDNKKNISVYEALLIFQKNIFSSPHTKRSEKHISSPATQSACKRLNLLLRWLLRKDTKGIDFGIWHFANPSDLIIPLDIHVLQVCKDLKIISAKARPSWQVAIEITNFLKQIDKEDPTKFDFALMGIGLE